MSSSAASAVESPRRALTARQAATVDGLTEAAVIELRAVGYGALTVRNVAKRAGVAPATAYTYFASKEHLVAEVYWRRFRAQPDPPAGPDRERRLTEPDPSPVERATAALSSFALVVADEADLSAACTVAVLADDEDVRLLRERIGAELHRRLLVALGRDVDPATVATLQFAVSGALLQVGTGHLSYSELPSVLASISATVIGSKE